MDIVLDAFGRIERCCLCQLEYEFGIVHRPGVEHQTEGALSRISTNKNDTTPLEDTVSCLNLCGTDEGSDLAGESVECSNPSGTYAGIPEVMALVEDEKEVLPITMEKFLKDQSMEPFCKVSLTTVRHTSSLFDVDQDDLLMPRATIYGGLQKVVPASLWARVLYLSHYPGLAGHPGSSRM